MNKKVRKPFIIALIVTMLVVTGGLLFKAGGDIALDAVYDYCKTHNGFMLNEKTIACQVIEPKGIRS